MKTVFNVPRGITSCSSRITYDYSPPVLITFLSNTYIFAEPKRVCVKKKKT